MAVALRFLPKPKSNSNSQLFGPPRSIRPPLFFIPPLELNLTSSINFKYGLTVFILGLNLTRLVGLPSPGQDSKPQPLVPASPRNPE